MENFVFYIPTKVFFGKRQIENLPQSIKNAGGSRALLAYGGGSIKKNGIYDDVTTELKKAGIPFFELSDIKPNPRIESVKEGIDICRQNKVDFILAVGGGSTVDACKAIAAGVNYEGDVFDLISGKEQLKTALPLGAVLTLAATGTEMDCFGVVTAGADNKKYFIADEKLYPSFSILDPQYTATVSKYQTAAGCSDILSHLMEQYFIPGEYTDVQDRMNEGVMKTVVESSPKILDDLTNYDLRSTIMWASSMALAGVQFGLGKPKGWSVHTMGHELSSLLDMTHGVTLALITPSWMKHTIEKHPKSLKLFANFGRNVFGINEKDDKTAAEQGVQKLRQFYDALEIPKCLKDAGVPEDKLQYLAKKATENGPLGVYQLDENDVYAILKAAY